MGVLEGEERERLRRSRVRVWVGVWGLDQRITTEATEGEEE